MTTYNIDRLLKNVEKPARYIGNEINSVKKNLEDIEVRFAFAFPDTYEIGMSYMGMQILYNILNKEKEIYCERVFAPASDMENLMRQENYELFSLETKTPIRKFDFLGFTLQYEMGYTNILNMLNLANIPLYTKDRDDSYPLIVAGGPCAYNPEPLADFFDLFMIGDGEEIIVELSKLYNKIKNKEEFLKKAAELRGVYVPKFYDVTYNEDGTIHEYRKNYEKAPDRVKRCIVEELDKAVFPTENVVPFISTVHDRSVVEIFRGCTRGCRFCQAGMIYRPVRERSEKTILDLAHGQLKSSGHEELSLLSLSTSDYSNFKTLATTLLKDCIENDISLSLPSLRLDNFSFDVLVQMQKYKKSGLTFAPEAGTQRLRDVINKNITEEDIYGSCTKALELGWDRIKLYFMIGHPTETYEDLDGIVEIARRISELNKKINTKRAHRFRLTISVSNFVPKPHTPFQWQPQDTYEQFVDKHNYLLNKLKEIKCVNFNYHDSPVSVLEAVIARGDRRISKLLEKAYNNGCVFDAWSGNFDIEKWNLAFEQSGLDPAFYANRKRSYDEILPWDIIDSCILKEFLISENEKTTTTHDCREGCVGCGMNRETTCVMEGIKKR